MNISPSKPDKYLNLGTIKQLEVADTFRELLRMLDIMHQDIANAINSNDSGTGGTTHVPQYASAPTYVKGDMYFDTTLNKLCIGGASGWETITSV